MNKYYKNQAAFTMVELSIVLVIIGLLLSGTLVGTSMLKHAESRALLSEVEKLKSSVSIFQGTYKGLPGDLPNATTILSPYAGNGNGNGKIESEYSGSNEAFLALRHLQYANLIEGSYGTFTGSFGTGFFPATQAGGELANPIGNGNVMGSKARTIAMLYVTCCSNTDYARSVDFKNYISVFSSFNGDITKRAGVLTPIEAHDLDLKIDDGVPDTGDVSSSGSWNTGFSDYEPGDCYTGSGSGSAYYTNDTSKNEVKGCQMQFAYDRN